jgi:hypothetical protein
MTFGRAAAAPRGAGPPFAARAGPPARPASLLASRGAGEDRRRRDQQAAAGIRPRGDRPQVEANQPLAAAGERHPAALSGIQLAHRRTAALLLRRDRQVAAVGAAQIDPADRELARGGKVQVVDDAGAER